MAKATATADKLILDAYSHFKRVHLAARMAQLMSDA
jgi:hypothetical protein